MQIDDGDHCGLNTVGDPDGARVIDFESRRQQRATRRGEGAVDVTGDIDTVLLW